jgi:predicted DNA-binding transcriptional regulator AlpA
VGQLNVNGRVWTGVECRIVSPLHFLETDLLLTMKSPSRRFAPSRQVPPLRSVQLSFDMKVPSAKLSERKPAATRHAEVERITGLDQLLSTRDILKVTGKHRCTIHRWMSQGLFPPKAAQQGRRIGWLRRDVERWLQSSQPVDSSRETITQSCRLGPGNRESPKR